MQVDRDQRRPPVRAEGPGRSRRATCSRCCRTSGRTARSPGGTASSTRSSGWPTGARSWSTGRGSSGSPRSTSPGSSATSPPGTGDGRPAGLSRPRPAPGGPARRGRLRRGVPPAPRPRRSSRISSTGPASANAAKRNHCTTYARCWPVNAPPAGLSRSGGGSAVSPVCAGSEVISSPKPPYVGVPSRCASAATSIRAICRSGSPAPSPPVSLGQHPRGHPHLAGRRRRAPPASRWRRPVAGTKPRLTSSVAPPAGAQRGHHQEAGPVVHLPLPDQHLAGGVVPAGRGDRPVAVPQVDRPRPAPAPRPPAPAARPPRARSSSLSSRFSVKRCHCHTPAAPHTPPSTSPSASSAEHPAEARRSGHAATLRRCGGPPPPGTLGACPGPRCPPGA